MTRKGVIALLASIDRVWSNATKNDDRQELDARINLWLAIASDADDAEMVVAFKDYVREGHEWAPNPGQLYARTKRPRLTGDEAWQEALCTAAAMDPYADFDRAPEMSSWAVTRAADSIGWRRICHGPLDAEEWTRKEFIRAYNELAEAEVRHEQYARIEGVGRPSLEAPSLLRELDP